MPSDNMPKRAFAYVDGYNLYYNCLKGSKFKWLDLRKLIEKIIPYYTIDQVKFFTSPVSAFPDDPLQPQRQQTYWRALRTSNVEIYEGSFQKKIKIMKRAKRCAKCREFEVEVAFVQEKGSDVNLGSHLLLDAFNGYFDAAIIITNDSDLFTPMKFVRENFSLPLKWITPARVGISYNLKNICPQYNQIYDNALKHCQYPDSLTDSHGTFTKPKEWY